jgi:hypothetical protein
MMRDIAGTNVELKVMEGDKVLAQTIMKNPSFVAQRGQHLSSAIKNNARSELLQRIDRAKEEIERASVDHVEVQHDNGNF